MEEAQGVEEPQDQIPIRSRNGPRWDLLGLAAKAPRRSYREVKARTRRYYFDRVSAFRAIRFFEKQCYHSEGELAGQPLKLERWQRKIVARTFGWKHRYGEDAGSRVVRELYIEIPRKNGKSFLCSAFAAYLLFADQEPGAQIISAAADTKQAGIVYRAMREMVMQNELLTSLVGQTYRASMAVRSTASNFQVLSSKPNTKHGLNLHGGIIDELHAHKTRELTDVLVTGTGSRRQPLIVYITTAGTDRQSICWEKHEYALAIINRDFEDDSFYGVIFGAEEEDDWADPQTWYKANPNLLVSKKFGYMQRQFKKAQRSTEYENTFKQLDLDVWTEQAVRWLKMTDWDKCARVTNPEALKKRDCFIGLDLSANTDLTSMALIFPEMSKTPEWIELEDGTMAERFTLKIDVLPYFWVPEANLGNRAKVEEKRFRKWIAEGHMIATPGAQVDYERVRRTIHKLDEIYAIKEIAIDPWNAVHLSTLLDDDGFTVVPYRQGYASLSAPTKELEAMVLSNRIAHSGHPVLRWCAGNVAVEKDAAGNIKPSKKVSTQKIDGIVALVSGLGRVIAWKSDSSIYDERGIVTVGSD